MACSLCKSVGKKTSVVCSYLAEVVLVKETRKTEHEQLMAVCGPGLKGEAAGKIRKWARVCRYSQLRTGRADRKTGTPQTLGRRGCCQRDTLATWEDFPTE